MTIKFWKFTVLTWGTIWRLKRWYPLLIGTFYTMVYPPPWYCLINEDRFLPVNETKRQHWKRSDNTNNRKRSCCSKLDLCRNVILSHLNTALRQLLLEIISCQFVKTQLSVKLLWTNFFKNWCRLLYVFCARSLGCLRLNKISWNMGISDASWGGKCLILLPDQEEERYKG